MKTCSACKTEKDETEFNWRNQMAGLRSYQCRDCSKKGKKTYYASNKKEVVKDVMIRREEIREKFNTFKKTLSCSICQEKEYVCLDFHHLDPRKKDLAVSLLVQRGSSWKSITKEIEKCIIVCRNCHTKIHAGLIKI